MKNVHLLIIDPQNDFCDLPDNYLQRDAAGNTTTPQLAVPGAHADMQRLAKFIQSNSTKIAGMTVTLDSHHAFAIERPAFWQTAAGTPVAPFTPINAADIASGKYKTRHPQHTQHAIDYLTQLEAAGRYTHMVWPAHCEIGTWGHNIHEDVRNAYSAWEKIHGKIVNKVVKGTNPFVEHYSAIRAEVIDPNDTATHINHALLNTWNDTDILLVAGEAGSHCIKSTVEHIIEYRNSPHPMQLVLLTDCMSPVTGFEQPYQAFLTAMRNQGVLTANSTDTVF
jgi:nicotinamidase/pyrazinamidase